MLGLPSSFVSDATSESSAKVSQQKFCHAASAGLDERLVSFQDGWRKMEPRFKLSVHRSRKAVARSLATECSYQNSKLLFTVQAMRFSLEFINSDGPGCTFIQRGEGEDLEFINPDGPGCTLIQRGEGEDQMKT